MNKQAKIEHRNTDGLKPTDTRLLESPLDFIVEDHLHIRTMCAEIEAAATMKSLPDHDALRIRSFLMQDLPMLLQDEDNVLLPLLLKRADREDEVPRLKDRLDQEHAKIAALLPQIVGLFSAPISAWQAEDHDLCMGFIRDLRRHLILENAIILPLARLRLLQEDLETLRNTMLARRGLDSAAS